MNKTETRNAAEVKHLRKKKHTNFQEPTNTVATEKDNKTICEIIARHALLHPQQIAVIANDQKINYQSLQQKANEVAGELAARNIQPESLIGVCMHRSWELIATLLGIMQAGCTYLPLDPTYPKDRIHYMLQHSKAVAAIVEDEETANLCNATNQLIVMSDIGAHKSDTQKATPETLAYVIYTSGSTGKPKGVAIPHKNLMALRYNVQTIFSKEELQGMFAAASVSFDTSVFEIFGTLSLGGTIILAQNAMELTKLTETHSIQTCVMVPSSVQALLLHETFPKSIQCLVFGGEALKSSLVAKVRSQHPNVRILNAYGPTEDTVFSTIAEISPETENVTIGNSVPNSRSYIVDENMKVVPVGEAGELCLAGNKLANGYLYEEALTKERFVEMTPTKTIPETRLYKTGDLCRRTTEGTIEFLGRVDQQVKVRGFRIELEEIESVLETMPKVNAAAVLVVDGGIGQQLLKACIVRTDDSITDAAIKDYLAAKVPKYMVPQLFAFVETLPLLPNDKLDRKQLLKDHTENMASANVSAQESKETLQAFDSSALLSLIQKEIASIVHLDDPSSIMPQHTFESYGLDSLSTWEFSSRLSNTLGKKLAPRIIFENPTPQSLIAYITNTSSHQSEKKSFTANSLADFQTLIQSSHPTFQAAKANAWSVSDKSKLVQEVMQMVNDNRRNPYSKVLLTGSATKGMVGDAYNDEKQQAVIWTTNLYLGLNRDEGVIDEAVKAVKQYGTGMGTSAAASGMTEQHLEFEKEFAEITGKPAACLFPTGYTANVGAVAGLLGKNDVVIIDQLCHASIVDGARLCGATIRTFKHNDSSDLEAVLKSEVSPYRTALVVLEGVYSMGEGAAPVKEIVQTAKKYNALVLVDEAHSFGFYGKNGGGICVAEGISDQVDFVMTTLSKAMGSLGGVVSASREHVDLMKSASRAYIFQASISPADMAAALTALRRLRDDEALRARLWSTTRYMRKRFEDAGYDLGTGDGPIVTPHFSDKDKLYAIVQHMYKKGIQTSAVTYPIVEKGRGRLRLICSAAHTRDDVDKTLEALIEAEKEVDAKLAETKEQAILIPAKHADLENWVDDFAANLNEALKHSAEAIPELEISLQIEDTETLTVIAVRDKKVIVTDQLSESVSYCAFTIKSQRVIEALQDFDMQQLLQEICDGTCVLSGQIEPFIWFVGRIVDKRAMQVV